MKPQEGEQAFQYDHSLNSYSVNFVPDQENGIFLDQRNRVGRLIRLDRIAPEHAEAMMAGNLRHLRDYAAPIESGTKIQTTGVMVEEQNGVKHGISGSVIREFPGYKKAKKRR